MDRRDFLKYIGVAGASAALLKVNLASASPRKLASSNTLNILFDSWSSQVMFQQAPSIYPSGFDHPTVTGQRLNTILGAMKSYGLSTGQEWHISFTKPPITSDQLVGVDVYVSLTRYINLPVYARGTGFA